MSSHTTRSSSRKRTAAIPWSSDACGLERLTSLARSALVGGRASSTRSSAARPRSRWRRRDLHVLAVALKVSSVSARPCRSRRRSRPGPRSRRARRSCRCPRARSAGRCPRRRSSVSLPASVVIMFASAVPTIVIVGIARGQSKPGRRTCRRRRGPRCRRRSRRCSPGTPSSATPSSVIARPSRGRRSCVNGEVEPGAAAQLVAARAAVERVVAAPPCSTSCPAPP